MRTGVLAQWEYMSLTINSSPFSEDWIELSGDATRIQGLDPILNYYGDAGWEIAGLRQRLPNIFSQQAILKRVKYNG